MQAGLRSFERKNVLFFKTLLSAFVSMSSSYDQTTCARNVMFLVLAGPVDLELLRSFLGGVVLRATRRGRWQREDLTTLN